MKPLLYTVVHRARILYWRLRRPVRIGVRVAVFNERGEVLLVRHTYTPGWFFPGGGADAGETLPEAAARELSEETGLTPRHPLALLGIYTFFKWGVSDHIAIYRGEVRGEPALDPGEIAEARWCALDALPEGSARSTLAAGADLLARQASEIADAAG